MTRTFRDRRLPEPVEALSPVDPPVMREPTEEERDFLAIQFAAVQGLRLQISHELAGIDLERHSPERVADREARLINLRRALERAHRWRPLEGQLPRSKP